MAEHDARHRAAGESRYKVEPNVKDGKGGLRDLHTLHWLSKYLYGQGVGAATVAAGIFRPEEVATFRRCEDFLWTIRCFLHFVSGRSEEVLTFDVQPWLAAKLGYNDRGGLIAVERFMKHYFLIAKDVGDLTTILCSALEMQQLKASPGLSRFLRPLNWKQRRQLRARTDFRIDNDRLNVADADVFKRDPVNLIRFFAEAHLSNSFLHPDAIRLLRQSKRLIDDDLRENPEANRIFVELLTGDTNPEMSLRRMNEAGVLGRFVPEFGRVVGMTQFNMYHSYTIDEHLVRTVGMLTDIERGGASNELPLSTEIISTIKNRRALYVAAFLHDIGKGHTEDHSIVGARIARELCPRLGLTPAETETVVWLIEQHLTMSNIAQSRDLSDPKTIRDFANVVQSPERLKLLLLLTVADIRAVGPGVWNGWKGQLLRTLYYETEPLVAGGHTQVKRSQRTAEAQETLRRDLADWKPADVDRYIDRHYADYWLRTDAERRVEHAKLLARAERDGSHVATDTRTDAFTAITELTVVAPNHPAPAGAVRRRLRGRRGEHRRRAHHDDARRICARYIPSQSRLQGRRRRAPARQTHRRADRAPPAWRRLAGYADRRTRTPAQARHGLHRRTRCHHQQRAVGSVHGDRSRWPRPPGSIVRADQHALQPAARHHVGAHHHLRREGGRRVLRHGFDRQEGGQRRRGRRPSASAWSRCSTAARNQAARRRPSATLPSRRGGRAGRDPPG